MPEKRPRSCKNHQKTHAKSRYFVAQKCTKKHAKMLKIDPKSCGKKHQKINKNIVFLSIFCRFWPRVFEPFFILVWRAFDAPFWQVPPKEPREGTNPRVQKYFLKGTVFFVLRQRFFIRFLCFFLKFLSFILSRFFLDRALFSFVRRKHLKN